ASFTVSDETIREAGELCRHLGTVLHVHVAEDRADVEDARRRGYRDPLERLMKLDGLVPGSILAHGVHLEKQQVAAAEREGYWLVQNPRSNQGNRVGYPKALWASRKVALGADGYPSDMLAEEAELVRLAKTRGDVERKASAWRLEGGLRLAGERFGVGLAPLSAGSTADLIVSHPGQAHPHHVIVGGRVVIKDRVLQTADIEEIRAEAREEAGRLRERMQEL
ncbi:MAG: amidohydrolase family protein, partial [Acidobacteriota bacterium]